VHGYNVDFDGARNTFNEMYRRLFWLGYRGNFVGLTWHGNEGTFLQFDTTMQNAFQTSPSFWRFLRDDVRSRWAVPVANINLIVHSLGNLVVFDALRLQRRDGGGPLVNNVASLESATWPECYLNETAVAAAGGLTFGPDAITYPVNELKRHSWAFWFGQTGHEVPGALAGRIYHSFLDTDIVLVAMQYNDWLQRGRRQLRWWHYNRGSVPGVGLGFRSPAGHPNFYNDIPTLMLPTRRHYRTGLLYLFSRYPQDSLNEAVGAQQSPMATVNYQATAGDWLGPAGPFDFGSHSRYYEQSFPSIYSWYDEFLGDNGGNNRTPAIPIGRE
jgi:hypothetical protein